MTVTFGIRTMRIVATLIMLTQIMAFAMNANDRLYIENLQILSGETKQLAIYLANDTAYCAFQTDVCLPDGLEVVTDDGEYIVDLTGRKDRTHAVSTFQQDDGSIRIFVTSQSVRPFNGNSGAIAMVEVTATQDINNQPMTLQNSMLVEENGTKHIVANSTAYVNGNGHITGDVTGDGKVDAADVNAVINMVLGKAGQTAAGDVTGDGNVDIADVNAVINLMLGKEK